MTKNTKVRILSSIGLVAVFVAAAVVGVYGIMALSVLLCAGAMFEWLKMGRGLSRRVVALGAAWLLVVLAAALYMSQFPPMMLLLLATIAATDIGAWFFGRRIKSAPLFPSVSPNKTWGGHIAGMLSGAVVCVLLAGSLDLVWIGIAVATLAQYGDLTASYFKRIAKVKDASNLIPGHGGVLDRFDGWIYALPVMALVFVSGGF